MKDLTFMLLKSQKGGKESEKVLKEIMAKNSPNLTTNK